MHNIHETFILIYIRIYIYAYVYMYINNVIKLLDDGLSNCYERIMVW